MRILNESEIKDFVIELYEKYLNGESICETAKKIFTDYVGAEEFISKKLFESILCLETIGWNLKPEITIDEAKKILEDLKKEELEEKNE